MVGLVLMPVLILLEKIWPLHLPMLFSMLDLGRCNIFQSNISKLQSLEWYAGYVDLLLHISQDMLMMVPSASSSGSGNWVFKNKDYGRVSAAASLVRIPLRLKSIFQGCLQISHNFYS